MYKFSTAEELIKLVESTDLTLPELVCLRESKVSGVEEDEVRIEFGRRIEIMADSIKRGLSKSEKTFSGLCGGEAVKLITNSEEGRLLGNTVYKGITYSIAIMESNASLGKIVACPTAGSSGVVPGVLLASQNEVKVDNDLLVDSFLVASGIGVIVAENAMVSGAAGGCQAEVGTAAAMAAGGLTYMRGGDVKQVFESAGICLKVMLGLVCDPVAGLVECPCVKRNASGVVNAFMASELVMSGIGNCIPFDEIVLALKDVGESMDDRFKETAQGGIAATPTAKMIERKVLRG